MCATNSPPFPLNMATSHVIIEYCFLSVPIVGKAKKNKGKKRKHTPGNQAEQKRLKLEDDQEGLTDKDKNTLFRWKGLQQTTRPFIHPIRKLVRPGEVPDAVYVEQQEQLIRLQFTEIEKQQKQILGFEKLIKEQNHLISSLKDKHKALVLECQAAGVKLTSDLLAPINGSSCTPLPPSTSQSSLISSHPIVRLPPPHPPTPASPANIFSPPILQPAYSNISPTNLTPPPGPAPARIPPPLIRPHHLMDSTPHKTVGSAYPPLNPPHMVRVPNRFPLNQSQMLMTGSHSGHAQNQGPMSQARQQPYSKGVHTSPPMLIDDLTFSPLTSSELKELEPPPGVYPSHSLVTFSEDLDSILNLSMLSGSGAGYGVGVKEEELPQVSLQIDLRYGSLQF